MLPKNHNLCAQFYVVGFQILFQINILAGCVPPDPTCWVQGECEGLIDHTEEDIASREDCLQLCKSTLGCKWFTYQTPPKSISATCIIYHECETIDESCTTCVSGQRRCKKETGKIKQKWVLNLFWRLENFFISVSVTSSLSIFTFAA